MTIVASETLKPIKSVPVGGCLRSAGASPSHLKTRLGPARQIRTT